MNNIFECRYCQGGYCWLHRAPAHGEHAPESDEWAVPTADLTEAPPIVFLSFAPVTSANGIDHTYPSWYQFVQDVQADHNNNPNRRESRTKAQLTGWAGTETWDQAIHLAMHGWPDGLKRIKDKVRIVERFISPKQPRLELDHDIRGPGGLDMERYTQGRPDAWVVWEEQATTEGQSEKIITINYNCVSSCGVDAETLFNRGAVVCALIDILEHNKIRVELNIMELSRYSSGVHQFRVVMKRASDMLDLDRMAFALCNAATPRRLFFSALEQHVPNLDSHYGHPMSMSEEGAINLDAGSLAVRQEKDMVPWLLEQLAQFGIEVNQEDLT